MSASAAVVAVVCACAVVVLLVVIVAGLKCWARAGRPKAGRKPAPEWPTRHDGRRRPVRLLTLNAYLRPWGISEAHGDCKAERLRAIATPDVLGAFDVVVLQEAFATGSSYARELVRAGRSLGLAHHVWPPAPPFWSRQVLDSGLLVLSALPVVSTASMRFTHSAYSDSFAAKAVLHAALRPHDDGPLLHVFCVHLQSFYSKVDAKARAVQEAQLESMMAWVERRAPRDGPDDAVICGDLNIDARDPDLYALVRRHIVAAGFADAMGDPHEGDEDGGGGGDGADDGGDDGDGDASGADDDGRRARTRTASAASLRPPTCHVTYAADGSEVGTHRRSVESLASAGHEEHPVSLDYIFARRAGGTPAAVEAAGDAVAGDAVAGDDAEADEAGGADDEGEGKAAGDGGDGDVVDVEDDVGDDVVDDPSPVAAGAASSDATPVLHLRRVRVMPFHAPFVKMGALSDHAGVCCELHWHGDAVEDGGVY
mmetsp:Transcript_19289/g.68153  ORF Transcript_19289/g.68153 Transcript_19289/m.68153 type:complete len:483 (-) Transcript_19289:49-1497(-)